MKTLLKTLPLFILTAALVTNASAQTDKPAAAPTPTKAEENLQIVFVPRELMSKNEKSGKLKENTFYWTNATDNPESGPAPQSEEGKTFLRVQGKYVAFNSDSGPETLYAREKSETTINRAFDVPEGAKTAEITYTARASHDVWVDPAGKSHMRLAGWASLTREGKSIRTSLPKFQLNAGWKTETAYVPVPAKTQQIVVSMRTDGGVPLDIAALTVTFQ
jgi:hypothetical protein